MGERSTRGLLTVKHLKLAHWVLVAGMIVCGALALFFREDALLGVALLFGAGSLVVDFLLDRTSTRWWVTWRFATAPENHQFRAGSGEGDRITSRSQMPPGARAHS